MPRLMKVSESRKSDRRLAAIPCTLKIDDSEHQAQVSDLSARGALLEGLSASEGKELECAFRLGTRDIQCSATVVWSRDDSAGISFREISSRLRNELTKFSAYKDLESAVVDMQRNSRRGVSGNMLPTGSRDEIVPLIASLRDREVEVFDRRRRRQGEARLNFVEGQGFSLSGAPSGSSYALGANGALLIAFELLPGKRNKADFAFPTRVYVLERRSAAREKASGDTLVLGVDTERPYETKVLDWHDGGAAVEFPGSHPLLIPGTVFSGIEVIAAEGLAHRFESARIQHVEGKRIGLQFFKNPPSFDTRGRTKDGSSRVSISALDRTKLGVNHLFRSVFGAKEESARQVVEFTNDENNRVAAIVDYSDQADPRVGAELVYVVAPAFLRRKETMLPLARTLVDNLSKEGISGATLRLDHTYMGHESFTPPEDVAAEHPYYQWNYSHSASDLRAAVVYAKRRLRAKKIALVSISASALAARLALRDPTVAADVDFWVAPFGCSDAQDLHRNIRAGFDGFEEHRQGKQLEDFELYGRPFGMQEFTENTAQNKLAYVPDARQDFASFPMPILWILGQYDFLVTNSRVAEATQGSAVRRVLVDTGHVAQRAEEALNVFRLISEETLSELYERDTVAMLPNTNRIAEQGRWEKARTKDSTPANLSDFWKKHLLGSEDGKGYDIVADNPTYSAFAEQQVELLEPSKQHRVLDVGCGTGVVTRFLGQKVASGNLFACDLVPEGLARAKEKVPHLITEQLDLSNTRLCHLRDFASGEISSFSEFAFRMGWERESREQERSVAADRALRNLLWSGASLSKKQLESQLEESLVRHVEQLQAASQALTALRIQEAIPTAAAEILGFREEALGNVERHGPFDRVLSTLCLSYLEDPLAAMAWFRELLAPGGQIAISTCVPDWDPSRLYFEQLQLIQAETDSDSRDVDLASLRDFGSTAGQLAEYEADGAFHFFSEEELSAMLVRAGFDSVSLYSGLSDPPLALIAVARKGAHG